MKKILSPLICALLMAVFLALPAGNAEAATLPTPENEDKQTPTGDEPDFAAYQASKDAAMAYLKARQDDGADVLYVYRDFSLAENHFTQKAKIDDGNSDYVYDMNENWQDDPYSGDSAIEVRVKTAGQSWGGWLFLNGYLPEGETQPKLNFGEVDGAGLDLSGATKLTFMAKGAQGGEMVEFFTAGLGYDGETGAPSEPYHDSTRKITLGFIQLSDQWQQYTIDLGGVDLSSIGCGFGFVLSGNRSGDVESVFYLDEIRFEGPMAALQGKPRLIKSYETDTRRDADELYIQNAAFSYDNALAALAFISDGKQEEAKYLLDAFAFAVANDRFQADRVRNAYAYGDISPFPGWQSGTRLPGWYDNERKEYLEDQYQVGSNVGNTAYVALALLQYYKKYGGEEYLALAEKIMGWVLDNCADGTPGFTAGYDGWPEGDGSALYTYTYKSTEHNIDAYAVFKQLYALTGEARYQKAAESAKAFIISMYDLAQGYFYTGTGNDGVAPNKDNRVLDAQVWSYLALGSADFEPYQAALDSALTMKTAQGGYPFHAANTNGGWWPEGTAFTALTLRQAGMNAEAESALDALEAVQLPEGGFPAATVAELSTGFNLFTGDPWTYKDIPHIAPAAWYVMAVNNFNPYAF
ncbi:MAG: hypothetical protein HPY72_04830 [Anaerolineae bacterium]|nr:hypothetical protein [Anaerolineae bacterium]